MTRISRLTACLVATALAAAAPASFAVCTYAKAPGQFPDGTTATLAEMVEAQKSVKQFMADMDLYLKCIDSENPPAAADAKLSDDEKKAQDSRERVRAQKHNAAVSDMEGVAERFNVQLHAWKDKNAAKPK